ncbi:MAG: L,D-transpeptidase family protein [Firmicutes bacterium]|nr:L,D-transpeptidase family protein [Bacillota bacterium]
MLAKKQTMNHMVPWAGPKSRAWLLGLAVIMLMALGIWLTYPTVHLNPSRRGLIRVSIHGWGVTVSGASFTYDHKRVNLIDKGNVWYPNGTVPSGVLGVVNVSIQGLPFLSWVPGESRLLTTVVATPPIPRLQNDRINRLLQPNIGVDFRSPVSVVRYKFHGRIKTEVLAVPTTRVELPMPLNGPGATGKVTLQATARSWEVMSGWQTVVWDTVPYLSAVATPQTQIAPTSTLTVRFSQPIDQPHLHNWVVSPKTAGSWARANATTYTFTPSSAMGFGPGSLVSVGIPSGSSGPQARTGSYLSQTLNLTWATVPGSVLRLQQLLAEEGYLPVSWQRSTPSTGTATIASQEATVYNPPLGTFQWKYPNLPIALKALWIPGQMTVMVKGAIMQFERVNGLTVDGIAGPAVWSALLNDRIAGRVSPDGYTYISVTENLPETMELWINGKLVLSSDTNTGIPVTPTYLGTFPIYERLTFQIMRGNNPNGTPYADPVYWINYFQGSDAVHGFLRTSYGFPQSLGCVELPLNIAPTVYHDVHYGTLVTVNAPGVAPAPAQIGGSQSTAASSASSSATSPKS